MWPVLIVLALATPALLIALLRWRQKFLHLQQTARRELDELKEENRRVALQVKTQQDALFNSMIEGLLLLDESGRIQMANLAFMKLFEITTDIRGKTFVEAVRLHELAELAASISGNKQVRGHEFRLAGLTDRWFQINAAAISDAQGVPRGTVLVFHDLTRLKQLERSRQEFVANVSHELRTPLSLIKGYVETLLDGAKDNPEVETRFLQTIQRNTERLQFLIEDLLTISQLESGRLKMNLQPTPLRPLVDRILADLQRRADARNMTLENSLPDADVRADADRLQQVFGNLVENAIKYGHDDGHVTVDGKPSNGMFEVCVQDDGPGIPAESLERVFERFYRVDKARSREQGGTGLGLSIVKHIVQSHGGKVWARSELGKGTAFYFTLPVESPTAAEQRAADSAVED